MRDGTHKIKIYFDTSVLSYLKQDDSPERMAATITFWEEIKKRKDLDIFLSDVTLAEISDCYEPKRTFMQEKLKEISFSFLEKDSRDASKRR